MTESPEKPVIRHIPDYNPEDAVNHRLVALVRLEQFLDERTVTREICQELDVIARYARSQKERRIYNIAELILKQVRKYLPASERMRVSIPTVDFRLMEDLRHEAIRYDRSAQMDVTPFLIKLKQICRESHHPLVTAFIASLIKSYRERSDFSGMLDYLRK